MNGQAKIYIEKDKLTAYLEITPPSGEGMPCSFESVSKVLAENNIVYGTDESKIAEALLENNWGKKVQIAQGKPAVDG
jgi:uncharacterized protein (DUF342 family)